MYLIAQIFNEFLMLSMFMQIIILGIRLSQLIKKVSDSDLLVYDSISKIADFNF